MRAFHARGLSPCGPRRRCRCDRRRSHSLLALCLMQLRGPRTRCSMGKTLAICRRAVMLPGELLPERFRAPGRHHVGAAAAAERQCCCCCTCCWFDGLLALCGCRHNGSLACGRPGDTLLLPRTACRMRNGSTPGPYHAAGCGHTREPAGAGRRRLPNSHDPDD